MLDPKRTMDPFDENEVKGTRMPDYTKVAKDRDIYGELGWSPNFNIKVSKDNENIYPACRETFDEPKLYHRRFNTAAMTNNEFFRKNAPKSSVARQRKGRRNASTFGGSLNSRRGSLVTNTNTSLFGGSRFDTPFLLDKDPGNKFKVAEEVEKTVKLHQ